MDIRRTVTHRIVVSKGDLIRLLKAERPDNIVLQALPDSGGDVGMDAGNGQVTLTYLKEG